MKGFVVRVRATVLLALAAFAAPAALAAQAVRGTIVDAAGNPVAGAVITLLDSASNTVSRALSSEPGAFRLLAPRPGTYRIKSQRIGFRPTMSSSLRLDAGATLSHRVVVDAIAPLSLDTVHVENTSACRLLASDSSSLVFTAWEQVRTAIVAAQLTMADHGIDATTIAFERTLEPSGNRIRKQSATVRTQYVREPWLSVRPDSLRRVGYVVTGKDDFTTYYAPGLDVLSAPEFVEDHCFHLGYSADPKQLAIILEPTPARKRVAEIRGTVTLDRATFQLRRFEFKYVNVPDEEATYAGGEMEFARLRDGGWVISRWSIRMPQLERFIQDATVMQRIAGPQLRVAEIHVSGGALTSVAVGTDTLWARPAVVLTGTVLDSASRNPVPNAHVTLRGTAHEATSDKEGRFAISNILPGEYTADVRTPGLDSVNAVHVATIIVGDSAANVEIRPPTAPQIETSLCGNKRLPEPGIVVGNVFMSVGDSLPPNARVVADWTKINVRNGGSGPVTDRERKWLEARVAPDGSFRLCGVPMNTPLSITAIGDGAESPNGTEVRIPAYMRNARADVALRRVTAGRAVFFGVVTADSTGQAVEGAEITLPELSLSAVTGESGTFRIADVPAGTHRVIVRRLGFSPMETQLAFDPAQRTERHIQLARATVLEAVHVSATAFERAMQTFDDHRSVGLGHFLTRDDLAKQEGLTMGAVLVSLPGIGFQRGHGNQWWVVSSRGPQSIMGRELKNPDSMDSVSGAPRACYARVYVDNHVVYHGNEYEPLFDVNSIHPEDLEAVEYYAGPAQTPGEYNGTEATCGVLALWTRRSP